MTSDNFSIASISGQRKPIDDGIGTGGGYVAYNDDKNQPIDFSATGYGDPLGYKKASIWT